MKPLLLAGTLDYYFVGHETDYPLEQKSQMLCIENDHYKNDLKNITWVLQQIYLMNKVITRFASNLTLWAIFEKKTYKLLIMIWELKLISLLQKKYEYF